jgi:hypothetical protein
MGLNEIIKKLVLINTKIKGREYDAETIKLATMYIKPLVEKYGAEKINATIDELVYETVFVIQPSDIALKLKAQEKAKAQHNPDELFDILDKAGRRIQACYHEDLGWTDKEKVREIYNNLPAVLREYKHSPMEVLRFYQQITDENESYIKHDFKEVIQDFIGRREILGIGYGDRDFKGFESLTKDCFKQIGGMAV